MKYVDSQNHTETITTDGTTYSPWFDVSFANELYAYIDTSESGTASDETLDITVERYTPYRTASHTTVLTFTQITFADLTVTQEKNARFPADDGSAPGADNKLGMKVRFKYDAAATTWATTVTVYSTLYAKRN